MLQIVEEYIENLKLLKKGSKVLIGLSGGADSVALLLVLQKLGYDCIAAHCNFHLRDNESDRDERFVSDLCSARNVLLERIDFDTELYCRERGLSIEMGARELRYEWFEKMREKHSASAICIAHHRDDAIETFFLNLIHGTGINGLCGIRPVNGFVVRPLLCVDRADILSFLENERQDYVTDSTNLESHYTRNRIRNIILPEFECIDPGFRRTMALNLSNIGEQSQLYNETVAERLSSPLTSDTPHIGLLTYEWLKPYGFTPDQARRIASALDCQVGRRFHSPDYTLVKERAGFVLYPNGGDIVVPDLLYEEIGPCPIEHDSSVALLDKDRLKGTLLLRRWCDGDSFRPLGMSGFKKLSDFLTDIKVDNAARRNVHVLTCGDDIVWVVGYRIDDRYKITSSTQRVLKVSIR